MSWADLSTDILLDHLLPLLPYPSITALSRTCRPLRAACEDESFWRGKIRRDFGVDVDAIALELPSSNHSSSGDSQSRYLWLGLKRPRVYVWGSSQDGRLGLPIASEHLSYYRQRSSVPYPVEITSSFRTPGGGSEQNEEEGLGGGIVELRAGGWGFAARDSSGGVWVWGRFDGLGFGGLGNPNNASHQIRTPSKLRLPCKAVSISMGRRHLLLLDEDNLVWESRAPGRVYQHRSPLLTAPLQSGSSTTSSGRPPHILSISAGWNLSCALSSDGRVFAWKPFDRAYGDALTPSTEMHGIDAGGGSDEDGFDPLPGVANHGEVLVRFGAVNGEEVVQQLPAVDARVLDAENEQRIVQVSAGNEAIVALRANGDVWIYKLVDQGSRGVAEGEWEHLASMSSPSNRAISASYRTIIAYSDRQALLAELPEHFAADSPVSPDLTIESLNPSSSSSSTGAEALGHEAAFRRVAAGDYHKVAVNGRGECYTWGSNDGGQLGLAAGGPDYTSSASGSRSVENHHAFASYDTPQRVRFGAGDESWRRQSSRQERESLARGRSSDEKKGSHFVFDICANGWQSGALVVDLPPLTDSKTRRPKLDNDNDDDHDADNQNVRPSRESATAGNDASGPWTPMVRALPPSMLRQGIRIGFAGRAAYRGGQGLGRGGGSGA